MFIYLASLGCARRGLLSSARKLTLRYRFPFPLGKGSKGKEGRSALIPLYGACPERSRTGQPSLGMTYWKIAPRSSSMRRRQHHIRCGCCPYPRAPGALALSLDRERDLECLGINRRSPHLFIVGSVKPFKGFTWFIPNAARGIAHATCAPRARLTMTLTLILSLKEAVDFLCFPQSRAGQC